MTNIPADVGFEKYLGEKRKKRIKEQEERAKEKEKEKK